MRYKKKKRQIVSAALAAMLAMQLCIPSATFAAVPTKKLKVITGFTELPEEVAHIQIPADAGENFEDFLNFLFPEFPPHHCYPACFLNFLFPEFPPHSDFLSLHYCR